jgi:hypothetical protein
MSSKSSPAVATMGIDIGKNSFHVIGLDVRGAIVLRQKWSRGQLEARFAWTPALHSFARYRSSRGSPKRIGKAHLPDQLANLKRHPRSRRGLDRQRQ